MESHAHARTTRDYSKYRARARAHRHVIHVNVIIVCILFDHPPTRNLCVRGCKMILGRESQLHPIYKMFRVISHLFTDLPVFLS